MEKLNNLIRVGLVVGDQSQNLNEGLPAGEYFQPQDLTGFVLPLWVDG